MLETLFSVVPCESQIHLFGLVHLTFLVSSIILAFFMIKYKKESVFLEKLSTLIVLGMHLILYGWYYFSSESFIIKALPLYTCRMVLYLYIGGIFFKNKFCLKLATYWGFFGGIAGLLLPTMFKYPFPHILQITTLMLHVYIFLLSTNYLFVKKIGMDKEDTKMCSICTVGFLMFTTVFNMIFGSNYTSTFKMPAHLINFGFKVPTGLCFTVVTVGYLIAIFIQHIVVEKCTKNN